VKLLAAGVVLGVVLWLAHAPVAAMMPRPHVDLLTLLALAVLGGVVYGGIVLALFGRDWLKAFRARLNR
jgi:putative peptidoglycan lipid II flippase